MSFGDSVDYGDLKVTRVGDVTKRIVGKKKFYCKSTYRALRNAWEEAVGEEIAGTTKIMSYENGILKIAVFTPILLHELRGFMKDMILDELKKAEGGEDLKDMMFIAG